MEIQNVDKHKWKSIEPFENVEEMFLSLSIQIKG